VAEPRTSSRNAVIGGESGRSPRTPERTFQRTAGSAEASNDSTMDPYTARLCTRANHGRVTAYAAPGATVTRWSYPSPSGSSRRT